MVIALENEGVDQIYGTEPYETYLANRYAWGGDALENRLTGYYAVCHPSAPNYLALTSGQSLQCGSDAYTNYTSQPNLFGLLQSAGESWTAYAESMPTACDTSDSGEYAVRHNPAPYYGDLGGGAPGSACRTHDLPIANLTQDFPYNATPPNFTFITPNLKNDGHDTSAGVADWFLSQFVSKLVNQTWFSSTAIFVVYDESYGSDPDSGYDGLVGGPVYMAAVSPYSEGVGAVDRVNSSHYNLLSTVEWLLDLPGTGTGNDSTAAFPAMRGLFNFSTSPPLHNVSGVVSSRSSGVGIPGAEVSVGGVSSTSTDALGRYSIALPNGSYALTASASGFATSYANVTVAGTNVSLNFSLVSDRTPAPGYVLEGTVYSAPSGEVIPGANVSLTPGGWATTPAGGNYSFRVANGTYNLSVSAAGYVSMVLRVEILGADVWQNVSLLQRSGVPTRYLLTGRVISNLTGATLEGANVSVNATVWQLTGTSGSYSLLLANGSYVIHVQDSGYESAAIGVTVAGQPVTQNIRLDPNSTARGGATSSLNPGPPLGLLALAVAGVAGILAVTVLYVRRRPPRTSDV